MKKRFIFLIILSVIAFDPVKSQTFDDIVIKSSDLEFIAVTRLSDIFAIIPQLDLYTIDRYRHSSLTGNLFENMPREFVLLVNGVKSTSGILGKVNINQIPLHINSIDSIIVKFSPTLYHGIFSSGILIDIVTKTPAEGISLTGTYSTGNETGDPGPYRYTEHFSNNVDQFGPNTLILSEYGGKKFNLAFSFSDQVSPATDPAILKRTDNFVFQNYQVRYSGFSLLASTLSGIGKHNLYTTFSKTGQAVVGYEYGADLIFLEPLSREIPYENKTVLISSGNEIGINNNETLLLDISLDHSIINQSKYFDAFRFNSEELLMKVKIGYSSIAGTVGYLIGSSFDFQKIKSSYADFELSRKIPSFYASVNFKTLKGINTQVDFKFRKGGNSSGLFVKVENNIQLANNHSLLFTVFHDNLFNIQNSLNYRVDKGYTFPISYRTEQTDYNKEGMQNSVSLGYSFKPDIYNTINSGLSISNYSDLVFVLNNFGFNSESKLIENEQTKLFESVSGWECEFYSDLTNNLFDNLSHKIYYRYKKHFSGDNIFKQVLKRIPEHKIFYSVYYKAYNDLLVSLTLNYSSSTEWIEYGNIKSSGDDLYNDKPKNILLMDSAVSKKFWNDKIRISVMIFNLLNRRIQYHPVGGSFDLTFFLKVEAEFESIIKP
ncbi:MAG: hypothetical protein R6W68_16135 [Ignavibacteriaceae bacterium]